MPPRTAIVTGGARGIGAAIAARLSVAGHRVASLDLVSPESSRADVLDVACDLQDAQEVNAAIARVTAERGAASIIVHCAAFQTVAPFAELDLDDWERTFAVNVGGAFRVLRAALPPMRTSGWGRIIVITSSTYFAPPPGMSHYIASKGALTGLVRGLSAELGGEGITVNAVAPGLTRTEKAVEDIPAEHFAAVRARQSVPRSGEPDDIAAAVAFLASDDAGFITGQTLLVDGGESRI